MEDDSDPGGAAMASLPAGRLRYRAAATLHDLDEDALACPTLVALCAGEVSLAALPEDGSLLVGRDPTCDLVIDHPSVSRHHARVFVRDGVVSIVDLGSANGTHVLGRRLARGEEELLEHAGSASVGTAVLVHEGPARASGPPGRSRGVVSRRPATVRAVGAVAHESLPMRDRTTSHVVFNLRAPLPLPSSKVSPVRRRIVGT